MDDSAFETLADAALAAIQTRIEDEIDDIDAELRGGILTLELDDGRQYVINRHTANRQIWLSSPISGAAHFDYDASGDPGGPRWVNTRGGFPLHDLLAAELAALAGQPFTFD